MTGFIKDWQQKIAITMLLVVLLLIPVQSPIVKAEGDMRLDIPFFRQIWEPWGKQNLGFSGDLIENSGCALTSLAMVFKYYGVDTDPARLNEWLKENNGYQGSSSIMWSKAVELSGGNIKYLEIENFNGTADLDKINWLLDSACPVIARMNYQGTNHYVVISGHSGTTYYLNDPWYENPARTVNDSYEPYNDPASSIKGIVILTSENPVPPRVPVTKVESIFTEGQLTLVHPMKNPEIVLQLDNPYMTVNGVKREIDPGKGTKPVVVKDRTLLPIRAVMEQMNGKVSWDEQNEKIMIEVQGRTIELWVGKRTAFVNGWEFILDAEPALINGRTLVPLRFIAEKLGCKITWKEATSKIIIPGNK